MAGVIATIPKFQFSANGVPMVGGTLDTYIAGSTTPATTWQDSALTIANTNPISLDARGECVLWLDPAVVYKFVLKNAQGVIQWTQDNISNPAALANSLRADLAASSGAALVGGGDQVVASIAALRLLLKTSASKNALTTGYYTAGDGGGGARYYCDVADTTSSDNGCTVIVAADGGRWKISESAALTVKQFGAKGDGVTDDRAAIQLAIDASKGKRLYVPSAMYVISAPLTFTNSNDGAVILYGDSTSDVLNTPLKGSVLKYTGTSGGIFFIEGTQSPVFINISGITFLGNASADYGLNLNNGWYLSLNDCVFKGFAKGGASAIKLSFTLGNYVGSSNFTHCSFIGNSSGISWNQANVNNLNFDKCRFLNNTYAIRQGESGIACSSRSVNISGSNFEGNTYDVYSFGGAQVWSVHGNYFEENVKTSGRIVFASQAASPVNCSIEIVSNVFSQPSLTSGGALVSIDGSNGVFIKNNFSSYGNNISIYCAYISNCENAEAQVFSCPSGISPYRLNFFNTNSWVPGISFGGGSSGITYASREGKYQKTGNQITLFYRVVLTNKGSSSGVMSISGFPFKVASYDSSYGAGGCVSSFSGMSGVAGNPIAACIPSGDSAEFSFAGATQSAYLNESNATNSTSIQGSITYLM